MDRKKSQAHRVNLNYIMFEEGYQNADPFIPVWDFYKQCHFNRMLSSTGVWKEEWYRNLLHSVQSQQAQPCLLLKLAIHK
jgi:hypothetical protein